LSLQESIVVCTDEQRNSILRKSGEPRSYAALLRRVEQGTDAAFGSANVRRQIVRERQICIRMTPEIFARRWRSRLLLPAQVRPAALRQRLVDLNLALHVGPPVLTFLEADLPPEQDFLQEK
jgi:hypothetical protein